MDQAGIQNPRQGVMTRGLHFAKEAPRKPPYSKELLAGPLGTGHEICLPGASYKSTGCEYIQYTAASSGHTSSSGGGMLSTRQWSETDGAVG